LGEAELTGWYLGFRNHTTQL